MQINLIMTQENKELLLKDLCARIHCGVIVNVYGISNVKLTSVSWYGEVGVDDGSTNLYTISEVKPYLFPLSSMTETQCYELASIHSDFQDCWKYIKTPIPLSICNFEQIDWFNRNHIDYRGLIEKGLAIDATNLNIY